MSVVYQLIIFFLIIVGVLLFLRKFVAWKVIKSYNFIISDLKEKQALNPESAVELVYARRNFMNIGPRDYRPRILVQMVTNGIVGLTEDGKYYLIRTDV